jgi:hypothetical protein
MKKGFVAVLSYLFLILRLISFVSDTNSGGERL